MASSPLNSKTRCHARSISFPSRLDHPLTPQFDEHLCRLRASEASCSSSPSSIGPKLNGLQDLHNCVENLLVLPLTQQALAQEHNQKWVDEWFEGSLRILDACSTAKDALLQTKKCALELQSILRRKRGSDQFGLSKEVGQYLAQRKNVKKAIHKATKNLKGLESKCSFNTDPVVTLLREVQTVTITVLESLLSSISGTQAHPKRNSWSLVSKVLQSKRAVACKEEEETDAIEFDKVDAILHSLISHRSNKSSDSIHNVQIHLGKLESSIGDLEDGIECLFRCLIKSRVSLLNILNH